MRGAPSKPSNAVNHAHDSLSLRHTCRCRAAVCAALDRPDSRRRSHHVAFARFGNTAAQHIAYQVAVRIDDDNSRTQSDVLVNQVMEQGTLSGARASIRFRRVHGQRAAGQSGSFPLERALPGRRPSGIVRIRSEIAPVPDH